MHRASSASSVCSSGVINVLKAHSFITSNGSVTFCRHFLFANGSNNILIWHQSKNDNDGRTDGSALGSAVDRRSTKRSVKCRRRMRKTRTLNANEYTGGHNNSSLL